MNTDVLKKGLLKKGAVEFFVELVRTNTGYFYRLTHTAGHTQNTCPSKTAVGCVDCLEFYRQRGWEIEPIEIIQISALEQHKIWEALESKNLFDDVEVYTNGDGFVSVYTNSTSIVVEIGKFFEAMRNLGPDKPSIFELWNSLGRRLVINI